MLEDKELRKIKTDQDVPHISSNEQHGAHERQRPRRFNERGVRERR
jgi:hypothetical protein